MSTDDDKEEMEVSYKEEKEQVINKSSLSASPSSPSSPSSPTPECCNNNNNRFHILNYTKINLPFHLFDEYPSYALIQDKITGNIYEWDVRTHRKMRYPKQVIIDSIIDEYKYNDGEESLDNDNDDNNNDDNGKKQVERKDKAKHNRHYHVHPKNGCKRTHFISWEPQIVTWWNIWIGFIANTLWVVNGVYAVWPDLATSTGSVLNITYWTGVIGAFLFIITGYLGIVEVINQNHQDVRIPTSEEDDKEKDKREFKKNSQLFIYGERRNPIEFDNHGLMKLERCAEIVADGYPLVLDHDTKIVITGELDELGKDNLIHAETRSSTKVADSSNNNGGDIEENNEPKESKKMYLSSINPNIDNNDDNKKDDSITTYNDIIGHEIDIVIGKKIIHARIISQEDIPQKYVKDLQDAKNRKQQEKKKKSSSIFSNYEWWTSKPDWKLISVFNAYVFFWSTIIFFIPALIWYPIELNGNEPSMGVDVFFDDVLQVIPSLGFVLVGHLSMVEVSQSLCKTKFFSSIGYNVAFFNTLGGYGFLICGTLAIPCTVNPDNEYYCGDFYTWGSAFSTFWGSCFFWIAGVLECIEFASQHPIRLSTSASPVVDEEVLSTIKLTKQKKQV